MVQTVRLDICIRDHGIGHVDSIKTDVERFDLFALGTFPWETDRSKAVVYEFEDRKTVKLGYTARDLAEFLQRQGYSVLVSQWDPVVEYGTQHTWSRSTRFPADISANNHGNLIAVEPSLLPEVERACRSAPRRLYASRTIARTFHVN